MAFPAQGRRALLAAALCAPLAAASQGSPSPATQQIEITGSPASASGRDDVVAKVSVSREDIARYADASLADVLRRVPGVTVTGVPGRAPEVRLRGLGNGYTQILINGEAAPAGFAIDALSPSQVERIEVSRVATVDTASQAIAGTINIVLRTQPRRGLRQVDTTLAVREGRLTPSIDAQFSDRFDDFSYAVGLAVARRNDHWLGTTDQRAADLAGTPVSHRFAKRDALGLARSVGLTPKLSWAFGDTDRLSVEVLWRRTLFDDHSTDERQALLGPLPAYGSDRLANGLRTSLAQGRLQWKHRFDDGATLETRLGANALQRDADTRFEGRDELDRVALDEAVQTRAREHGLLSSGKLRLPYAADHAMAIGWEAERTGRRESRQQRQVSPIGRPVTDADEAFTTTVFKPALYAQDEWEVDDTLSAYAGVRVAALSTHTEGTGVASTRTRSSVLSPVLQLLKKLGTGGEDRLRFALSRTYKAPRAADLNPRRFVAIDNTPATPDLQGNPALRPELAWGADAGYEGQLPGRSGSWSAGLSARLIRDVVIERVQSSSGLWVARKENFGTARVYGLEAETRWRARDADPAWPDLELRASAARNWSRVDQVPGPDNRLGGQLPWSAQAGLDWKPAVAGLGLGGSFAYRAGVRTRSSATQRASAGPARTLDLYATWRASPGWQWRFALANALAQPETTTEIVDDETGRFTQDGMARGSRTFRLALELKL